MTVLGNIIKKVRIQKGTKFQNFIVKWYYYYFAFISLYFPLLAMSSLIIYLSYI